MRNERTKCPKCGGELWAWGYDEHFKIRCKDQSDCGYSRPLSRLERHIYNEGRNELREEMRILLGLKHD